MAGYTKADKLLKPFPFLPQAGSKKYKEQPLNLCGGFLEHAYYNPHTYENNLPKN